jgi:hypothetical protein
MRRLDIEAQIRSWIGEIDEMSIRGAALGAKKKPGTIIQHGISTSIEYFPSKEPRITHYVVRDRVSSIHPGKATLKVDDTRTPIEIISHRLVAFSVTPHSVFVEKGQFIRILEGEQ